MLIQQGIWGHGRKSPPKSCRSYLIKLKKELILIRHALEHPPGWNFLLFTLLSPFEVPYVDFSCQSKTCLLLLDLPLRERKSFAKILWSDQYIIPSIQIHTCTQPGKILSCADHDTLLIQLRNYYLLFLVFVSWFCFKSDFFIP